MKIYQIRPFVNDLQRNILPTNQNTLHGILRLTIQMPEIASGISAENVGITRES